MTDCDDTGRYAVYVRDHDPRCVGRTDKEGNARELMRACVEDLGKPHAEVYDCDDGYVIAQQGTEPAVYPDPPEDLADAWQRFQREGAGGVSTSELCDIEEWRGDCERDAFGA